MPNPAPPQTEPPRSGPRELLRSRTHRLVAGVAGGIGEYLNVDPVVVRLVFIVLTLAGGLGALLYLVAWLIVPEAVDESEAPEDGAARGSRSMWVAAGALVLLVLLGGTGNIGWGLGFNRGVTWPLALVCLGGAALWIRSRRSNGEGSPTSGGVTPTTTTTTVAPAPELGAFASAQPTVEMPTEQSATTQPVRQTRQTRSTSMVRRAIPVIGRLVLGVIGAVATVIVTTLFVAMLAGTDTLDVTPLEAVIAGAVAFGLAIWLGLRFHRLFELLACACAFVLVLSAVAWVRPPLRGGYGTRDIRPVSATTMRDHYRLAGGRLRLDLRSVTPTARRSAVSTSVGIGLLQVIVPPNVNLVFDGRVGAGEICVFGHRDTGLSIRRHTTEPAGAPTLHLSSHVGAGAIVIAHGEPELQATCQAAPTG